MNYKNISIPLINDRYTISYNISKLLNINIFSDNYLNIHFNNKQNEIIQNIYYIATNKIENYKMYTLNIIIIYS